MLIYGTKLVVLPFRKDTLTDEQEGGVGEGYARISISVVCFFMFLKYLMETLAQKLHFSFILLPLLSGHSEHNAVCASHPQA